MVEREPFRIATEFEGKREVGPSVVFDSANEFDDPMERTDEPSEMSD